MIFFPFPPWVCLGGWLFVANMLNVYGHGHGDMGRSGTGWDVLFYLLFLSPLLAGVKYWATAERYPACGPSLKYTKGVQGGVIRYDMVGRAAHAKKKEDNN